VKYDPRYLAVMDKRSAEDSTVLLVKATEASIDTIRAKFDTTNHCLNTFRICTISFNELPAAAAGNGGIRRSSF